MPARVQLELSILGPTLENKVWILGLALENKVWILGLALEIKFWILGPALHSIIGFLGSALEFSRVDCKHVGSESTYGTPSEMLSIQSTLKW